MMLSEGLLNKQIAYNLSVSEATVKAHVSAILQKLGGESRTQAVLAAAKIEALEKWLLAHHPYWSQAGGRGAKATCHLDRFLLGLAYPLRLVQAAQAGAMMCRLHGANRSTRQLR